MNSEQKTYDNKFLEGTEFIFDLYLGIFIHIGKIIQADELLNEIHIKKTYSFDFSLIITNNSKYIFESIGN